MKILLVSMASLHFFRWAEQLRDSGHEVYWFDVLDGGDEVARLDFVNQKTDWKRRWDFHGRVFIKKKFPFLYKGIQLLNECKTSEAFEAYLDKIQPDVVHSFALYVSCTPILEVMQRHSTIPWVYSSWGSDLFYYKNHPDYLKDIKRVLSRVNYQFSDCARDIQLAKELGFQGEPLGVFPGGGGYELQNYQSYKTKFKNKNSILVKGFAGRSGRAQHIVRALKKIEKELSDVTIVFFGTDAEVLKEIELLGLSCKTYKQIPHKEVLQFMGKAKIYIGNSISDGTPNTLLEAMIMESFPIQSNPGGATAEWITHKKNGLLLDDPEDVDAIAEQIAYAISHPEMLQEGIAYNAKEIVPKLERNYVRKHVLQAYKKIEDSL